MVLTDFYLREEEYKMQAVPGHGEGGGEAVGRGKGEQKHKNKKISMSKTNKKYSELCTQTCPYRLAGSALPSVFGGS